MMKANQAIFFLSGRPQVFPFKDRCIVFIQSEIWCGKVVRVCDNDIYKVYLHEVHNHQIAM